MNPYSKYLSQWSADTDFGAFVEQWDRLEAVVVGVYRRKVALTAAESTFDEVWSGLRARYALWRDRLRPYWQATQAAGAPTRTDPFQLLLDIAAIEAISGDWRAMQHLPAAREAINRYLVDHGERSEHSG